MVSGLGFLHFRAGMVTWFFYVCDAEVVCALRGRSGFFMALRWHPRFDFVLRASPFGVLAFALASAFC
jgi:hypothetical protein